MKMYLRLLFIILFILFAGLSMYSQEYLFITDIIISGNKKTDNNTILKELPFRRGEIIEHSSLENLLNTGKENINNMSLFNHVHLYHSQIEAPTESKYQSINIHIDVEERWYYWPIISMTLEERNFSSWLKHPDWKNITLESGFRIDNIAGKNQTLKAVLTSGFNKGFMFDYNNIHLDNMGKHLLGINFTRLYSRTENVYVKDNSPLYVKSDSTFLTSKYAASVSYTFRQKLRLRHKLEVSFIYSEIEKSLLDLNPGYWGSQDLKRRGYSVEYDIIADQRDNIPYPLKGYFIKAGITGFATNKFNILRLGVTGDLHYYKQLYNKIYFSAQVKAGISNSNVKAYVFNKAIGYNAVNLRGYEYYVADGQHYFVLTPTLKYNFLPNTRFTLDFLSFLPKFNKVNFSLYAKAFSDIGYAWHSHPEAGNQLSNKLLHSWGFGIDMAAYYDITLSADLSFNQLGDYGFYFTVNAPIR